MQASKQFSQQATRQAHRQANHQANSLRSVKDVFVETKVVVTQDFAFWISFLVTVSLIVPVLNEIDPRVNVCCCMENNFDPDRKEES